MNILNADLGFFHIRNAKTSETYFEKCEILDMRKNDLH